MSTSAQEVPQTKFTATQIREMFLQATDEPLRLKNLQVVGDLDLCFCCVRRAIHISNAEFKGALDIRNAKFSSALLLEKCTFLKRVNAGDTDLSNCVCESDLSFQGSRFDDAAWFVGL